MPPPDDMQKAAADLIERLLIDAEFRAQFRKDPAAACEEFGLDELAGELRMGAGAKAFQTLEIRQSMSSLAGVIMAAAAEGMGVFELARYAKGQDPAVRGVVNTALSRTSLQSVQAVDPKTAGAAAHGHAHGGHSRGPTTEDHGNKDGGHGHDGNDQQGPENAERSGHGDEQHAQGKAKEHGHGDAETEDHEISSEPDEGHGDGGHVPGAAPSVEAAPAGVQAAPETAGNGSGTPSPGTLTFDAAAPEAQEAPAAAPLESQQAPPQQAPPEQAAAPAAAAAAPGVAPAAVPAAGVTPPAAAPGVAPSAVPAPEVGLPGEAPGEGEGRQSGVFESVGAEDGGGSGQTVGGLQAVEQPAAPAAAPAPAAAAVVEQPVAAPAAVDPSLLVPAGPDAYPGDSAPKEELAAWMARRAQAAGLPPELPVMASLVESGLHNVNYGDADSIGFFQMRTSIWDQGEYAGYGQDPEKQIKWFIDHAVHERDKRISRGDSSFLSDPSKWGAWIADVERPAEQYRGRYQLRLDEARGLLQAAGGSPAPVPGAPVEAVAPAPGAVPGGEDHVDPGAAPGAVVEAVPVGGSTAEQVAALLQSPNLELPEGARADLASGQMDPRLVPLLSELTKEHKIGLSVIKTGHDQFTSSGSVSNHFEGRGLDIASVDGQPVNPGNLAARDVAEAIAALDSSVRPSEVGTPWAISAPDFFTDGGHQDHIHIGWDDPPPAGFAPPAAAPAAVPVAPVAPGVAPAAVPAPEVGLPEEVAPETEGRESGVFESLGAEDGAKAGGTIGGLEAVEQPAPAPAAAAAAVVEGVPVAAPPPGAVLPPIAPADMDNTNAGGQMHGSEFAMTDAEGAPDAAGVAHHAGHDLFAKGGAPVGSPVAGTVVEVKASRGNSGQIFGGVVKVQGPDGRVWVFRHVDPAGVTEGMPVAAGQQIANVTDWQGGPSHAHIELWKTLEGGYRFENMEDPLAEFQKAYAGGGVALPPDPHAAGGVEADHAGHSHGSAAPGAVVEAVPVGGSTAEQVAALLQNPNLELPAGARADLESGVVDPRMVSMLTELTKEHKIGLSVIKTGHDQFTSSGSVSNHFEGRGLDIASVDGQPVNPGNLAARDVAEAVAALDSSVRPSEVGTPWAISAPDFFTDGGHQDHIHIAYDDPPPAGFAPPAAAVPVAPAAAPVAPAAVPVPEVGAPEEVVPETEGRESGVFQSLTSEEDDTAEEGKSGSTVQFMKAVKPQKQQAQQVQQAAAASAVPTPEPDGGAAAGMFAAGADVYPGDNAAKEELAAWMARRAQAAGLPPELPVMASLVESGLHNVNYGDADSIGFFQMRTSIWDQGEYAGYGQDPEKQIKWFIDHAVHERDKRISRGDSTFLSDPSKWGAWIADVERPAEQYRGRYQLRLNEARALLGGSTTPA